MYGRIEKYLFILMPIFTCVSGVLVFFLSSYNTEAGDVIVPSASNKLVVFLIANVSIYIIFIFLHLIKLLIFKNKRQQYAANYSLFLFISILIVLSFWYTKLFGLYITQTPVIAILIIAMIHYVLALGFKFNVFEDYRFSSPFKTERDKNFLVLFICGTVIIGVLLLDYFAGTNFTYLTTLFCCFISFLACGINTIEAPETAKAKAKSNKYKFKK